MVALLPHKLMKYKSIKIYKTTFCGDCLVADRFFEENNIRIEETINIDNDEGAAALVLKMNGGYKSVPTIVIEDENNNVFVLVEPSWDELERTFK